MQALEMIAAEMRVELRIVEGLEALATYCTGWSKANAHLIRSAIVDDYIWDDPDEGRVTKSELSAFLTKLKAKIDGMRSCSPSTPYLTLSDVVIHRSQSTITVWGSFAVPGTGIQGMSHIRVGDKGVISEYRAQRTEPYVRVAGIRSRG